MLLKSIHKYLIVCILVVSSSAQETPISEIFFLDLGIVIEPEQGNEQYSRSIAKTSKERSFKIKKVESGSVYMASSKELLSTLNRINERISGLESSFLIELGSLRQENEELRRTMAKVTASAQQVAESNFETELGSLRKENEELRRAITSIKTSTQQVAELNDIPVNKDIVSIINHKPAPPKFDKTSYMSGVFAYQREDYKMALNYFTSVNIELAPKQTAENILYWMADAYQQSADYENALMLLNKIAISGSLRMDDALVKKGLLHRKRGEEQLAIAAFENVVSDHPDSEYVRLAQMELNKSEGLK